MTLFILTFLVSVRGSSPFSYTRNANIWHSLNNIFFHVEEAYAILAFAQHTTTYAVVVTLKLFTCLDLERSGFGFEFLSLFLWIFLHVFMYTYVYVHVWSEENTLRLFVLCSNKIPLSIEYVASNWSVYSNWSRF